MLKPVLSASLLVALMQTAALANGELDSRLLAYDPGSSSHRLPRPTDPNSGGGAAVTPADDSESVSPAPNQDDLRATLDGLNKEAGSVPVNSNAMSGAPKSRLLQGSIDQYGEAKQQAFNVDLGILAKREGTAPLPAKIFRVLPDSKAESASVRAGDMLLKEVVDSNSVHLTLQRAQKTLQITIKTAGMFDMLEQPTAASATRVSLSAGTTSVQLKGVVEHLRDHDVVLILDMSGSMTTRDCQGLSRWDWVGTQSNELAMAAQQASSDLTVMLFSSGFQVLEHVNPAMIPLIFSRVHPGGGTALGAPLNATFLHYFGARNSNPSVKPLIVVVITDGLPGDFGNVRQELIDAANATKRDGEVSVTFLLVNGHLSGNRLMEELDSQLGTQRDIVNLVEFDQVLRLGVKESLADALSGRHLQNVPLSAPSGYPYGTGIGGLLNGLMGPRGLGGNPYGVKNYP
ncbi:MAG TPA: VWA domain-containing protein [Oculatellaceae cyanobacterium]